MKCLKSVIVAASLTALCGSRINAQNTFPATGNVGIGVSSPTSLLHMAGTGQLSIGTPNTANTLGAALTSSELRFRSTTNFYMALAMVPNSYEMQFVNKNNGALAGFRADVVKVNYLYSMNNFQVAQILDGQVKMGGMGYGSIPLYVKENTAVPNFYPAMQVEGHRPAGVTAWYPLPLHISPAQNNADNTTTGISFGGTTQTAANYGNHNEASISVFANSGAGTTMYFSTSNNFNNGAQKRMTISNTGNVGINTLTPNTNAQLDVAGNIFTSGKIAIGTTDMAKIGGYALAVNGDAIFNKVKVKLYGTWPDFVFEEKYGLLPIAQLEQFIKTNKHLPNVPSAAEVQKDGIDLGSNQATLLQKIEELTLYLIQQQKQIDELKAQLKK
jgi:hypothetical protein